MKSSRKRRTIISDNSTPLMRKMGRHDKEFDERCNELLRFKKEFGLYNVPAKYTANSLLGQPH
jgi:hypothetical protein